jgi:hypothetical protein
MEGRFEGKNMVLWAENLGVVNEIDRKGCGNQG